MRLTEHKGVGGLEEQPWEVRERRALGRRADGLAGDPQGDV